MFKQTVVAIALMIALFTALPSNAQSVRDLDVSNKVINFASYCEIGKITIFEVSLPGCHPCEELKKWFLLQNYDTTKVVIYHCVISKGKADEMWGNEGISDVPVVYFYGPTGNPVKILHIEDKDYSPQNVKRIIGLLLDCQKTFNPKLVGYKR